MPLSTSRAGLAIALCAGLRAATGQNTSTAGPPWIESEFDSSPPVYPSPDATGLGWEDAFAQASAFVDQLTLEEKVQLATGTDGPCVGNIAPIYRLGFNGLCLQDGPLAIREADFASVFTAGITAAAAWDKELAHARGKAIGQEFVGKGANVALGPVAGPLGRSGYGGRNWEGFSPDPYLTGELFAETIVGMEETGIQACGKHYIGNEQETQRNPGTNDEGQTIEAVSSNIDDRTMHELYMWPFANGVRAGVSSIMCSYNRVNGSYGCANSKILNGLLKEELDFQGYVVSDWGAVHAGVAPALAGLDQNMPGGIAFSDPTPSYWGANLTIAVNNGSVPMDRVDDIAIRIMTPYFRLKQNEASYPKIDPSSATINGEPTDNYTSDFTYSSENDVDVRNFHGTLIRELGAAGIVLLKNTNGALPLKAPKNIGVFGNDAGDLTDGFYSSGWSDREYGYKYGVLAAGGGSGTGRFTYIVSPLDAIKRKAEKDGSLVQYVLNNDVTINADDLTPMYPIPPDVCLVFLKTWASEGSDRTSLLVDWNGTALVESVAENCANTVVITHSAGLNVLPFADHPNITAILAAHMGGEQVGNSIVDVLYGDVNPSGHLPYTITREEDDYEFAGITNSSALQNSTDPNAWQSDFKERLLIDYRHFDYYDLPVAYEFGFGLSYTTFDMGGVSVSCSSSESIGATPPANKVQPGGNPALWETLYTITATVTNTGDIAGHTVPQLYLGLPQPSEQDVTPVKMLRGFERVWLYPGESKEVEFPLMRRDISHWDIYSQDWVISEGDINVYAGFSSRDIKCTDSFSPLSA